MVPDSFQSRASAPLLVPGVASALLTALAFLPTRAGFGAIAADYWESR